MVAWSPLAWFIQCPNTHPFGQTLGCEHEIQLPGARFLRLVFREISGDIIACAWQLVGSWLRAAAMRGLRPYKFQPKRRHSAKHRFVPSSPVGIAVVAVAVKNV